MTEKMAAVDLCGGALLLLLLLILVLLLRLLLGVQIMTALMLACRKDQDLSLPRGWAWHSCEPSLLGMAFLGENFG